MNTQKMRQIAVLIHLTVHKVGFHLKFPATLSLELELDRKTSCIAEGISLGKDAVAVNKQRRFEAVLNYDESSKSYQNKKATILICIKTKTSENKLTAGVVPLQLSGPSQHLTNVTARPLRCNDPKAFIEYSLRTETLRKPAPDQTLSSHPAQTQQTATTVFKSAVYYNNSQWGDGEDPETAPTANWNELNKYLSAPSKGHQRKRYKSSGKLPLDSMQNCDDDSRTEVISSRREAGKECSIISSRQNSIERQAKQLSKRSEAISKEISEARLISQTLKAENKSLKAKVSKYEQEVDEQLSQIAALNKRYEVRENTWSEQAKQLKAKLSESESQLHLLLLQKNQLLNQMEAKQKESLMVFKQKEKAASEEKRKLLIELQLRKQQREALSNDNSQLRDSLDHSQRMATDLMNQVAAKDKEYLKLQKALEDVKLQMLEKLNTLQGLEVEVSDKGRAVQDLKLQKKLIYEIRQERDQKDVALAQSAAVIKELQLAIAEKEDLLRKKESLAEIASQANESLKNELKQEVARQGELTSRLKEYEAQLKRSTDNSGRITKQIKDVESELKGIKRQANNEASEKNRLVGDYESIIASLQERCTTLLDEKESQKQVLVNLNALHRQKEEECFDLGQQLIISKDEAANLTNELEVLREENNYLNKCLHQLAEKEDRLLRAEEKLQYNERLYEELQQKHELQRIQLQNEIQGLQQRGEEKTDALRVISDQLRKAEQEQLQLQDQIQTLRIGLANRTSELNFLRMEVDRNRDSAIQFEQRVALLRRTEETATSTLDQAREENDALRRVVHQNSQAITSLGKRYDSLYRSTVQSLTQLLELVRSDRSMVNSSLKHEKAEISSLLNDCIRYIGSERENAAAFACKMTKSLEEQSTANRENVKIIRLKAQMQKELEDEMQVMRAFEESLQTNIAKLNRDIENNQQTIRQKESVISDLHADIAALHRDHATALARKDDTIQMARREVDRLNHQIDIDAEKYNTNLEKVKLAMANLEADLQAKISALKATISELGGDLKAERETSRQQTAKISELESANTKITKQKQQGSLELERRTGELIALRLECENRSKSLSAKQVEAIALQRSIDKLSSEKVSLQSQLQQREGTLKEISTKKGECEAILKERNNEILLLKMKIDETEDAKNKLIQQREELIKGKGIQQALISTLNQSIKAFKDSAILTEDRIKKLCFEKECIEKENGKKLNIAANEKTALQRQLNELKLRAAQKESDFAAKERALQEELKSSKAKVGEHSSLILDLRREVEAGNAKISSLVDDFNAKIAELQSKEKSLLPSAGKLKEVMQSIGELRAIGKEYEASKAKLLRITNSARLDQQDYERTCEVARELGIAINKVKIQVLNRLGLPTEAKTTLLEGLKGLQAVAEKLSRG